MKNLLKKFLLIFVVGILSQPYVENTCWASKAPKIEESQKIDDEYEYIQFCSEKELDIQNLFEEIKERTKDKMAFSDLYSPLVFHESRGCIVLKERIYGIFDYKVYVLKTHYITSFSGQSEGKDENSGIKFIRGIRELGKSQKNVDLNLQPLGHSEIAFIQHITGRQNPLTCKGLLDEKSILHRILSEVSNKELIILINNSMHPPCNEKNLWCHSIKQGEKVSNEYCGMWCDLFLDAFCFKLRAIFINQRVKNIESVKIGVFIKGRLNTIYSDFSKYFEKYKEIWSALLGVDNI